MIYYSHRTRKALAEGKLFLPLGFAHYSYGTVCRKFLDMFEQARMPVQELLMPEIYHARCTSPSSPMRKSACSRAPPTSPMSPGNSTSCHDWAICRTTTRGAPM
jgi:hypothetical protein